ncbi:DUF4159 domain-containing protein [Arcticibacter eurypsychrophilus]|uniref:DUF4159 domain-containing protein n=1 Tax=Arcticibacter eurypsychrophilus TaxID=1434752 RepID=UPI00084D21D5|nr:DUF4159 domain-containing protein [Arcticibacter eurypsychrophilus]
MKKTGSLAMLIVLSILFISAFAPSFKIARLKYNGGGDWYANRTALQNLVNFCNLNLLTNIDSEEGIADVGSATLFQYPFVYATGHGNILFSEAEAKNLRKYLIGGGFLHIDDNYGLDKYVRPQMKKVFPELTFVELPASHPVYHQKYEFSGGLPKVHEHDGKRSQGFALIHKGRMVCFYTYECDLGNGWEDYGTYEGDSEATRQKALKMGANLIQYALGQ